jgi:hypothetical protein
MKAAGFKVALPVSTFVFPVLLFRFLIFDFTQGWSKR